MEEFQASSANAVRNARATIADAGAIVSAGAIAAITARSTSWLCEIASALQI